MGQILGATTGDPVADQLDAGKAAHGGNLDQGLFHGRVTEGVPLLQQVNAKQRCQRVGRPAAFLARFWVVGVAPLRVV